MPTTLEISTDNSNGGTGTAHGDNTIVVSSWINISLGEASANARGATVLVGSTAQLDIGT